jgi:type I restriction enzyme S subunit
MVWETKTLNEVCIVQRGSSPRPIKNFITENDNGVNWIKIGDTKGVTKYIHTTNQKITKEGAEKSRRVEVGDFILSNSMSFGKPYIMATSGYIHDGWFVLRLPDYIDRDFFYYLLGSPNVQKQFIELSSGAIVKNISGDLVKKAKLPIPPLETQKQIVAKLDLIFVDIEKAKVNAEQNLLNAKELLESYLQQIFSQCKDGWVTKSVGEMAASNLGKMLDKQKNKGELKPYLRNSSVRWFNFNLDDVLEMRFEPHEVERYSVQKGDLLICEGGYPGRAAIWDKKQSMFFQKAIHRVRFHDLTYNKWLLYFLFYSDSRDTLKEHFTGTGIQHLTGKALKNLSLIFPPPEETAQYTQRFDHLFFEVEKLKNIYIRKLIKLDELKQSILQKAFNGELA